MILVVYGTRPEALKLAGPVKLARERGLPIHVHCTGQSPDLLDKAVLPWDSRGDYHALHFEEKRWDFVVVVGDTRTVWETAWLAFELGVPIFFVESGVRTWDITAPYPEEAYRQSVSVLAKWHACTTEHNLGNLLANPNHGLQYGPTVRITGSPIVESVRERASRHGPIGGPHEQPRILVTLHRRENRGHFADIIEGIREGCPDGFVEWTTHPNGWAAQEAPGWAKGWQRSPMPPDLFTAHLTNADVVVTDSGGVQEECNALGVPCVVVRTVTDRPESLGPRGGAILGGNTRESISAAIQEALQMDRSQIDPTIFGDGKASERLVDWWTQILEGQC